MSDHADPQPSQPSAEQPTDAEPTPFEPQEQWITYIEKAKKPAADRKETRAAVCDMRATQEGRFGQKRAQPTRSQ